MGVAAMMGLMVEQREKDMVGARLLHPLPDHAAVTHHAGKPIRVERIDERNQAAVLCRSRLPQR